MRDSPALAIIPNLVDKGANVQAHDPQGMDEAKLLLPGQVNYFNDVYEAAAQADAIVLLTEWNEYRGLKFERLKGLMQGNAFVDLRNVYERQHVSGNGFDYYCIGR